LDQKQKIETIFQAMKICLPVIPNLQLIVIGEGRERKNLAWLAKKMKIENLVWLVGEQEQLKKWLDSFDIFLAAGDALKLDDCGNILEAMAAGLPVLGPRNIGLENLVVENKTGALIEADNSEMLARQIIKLHQDKKLRVHLGKNGQERASRLFTLEEMTAKLEQIFKVK
jgi:glycosyltransferase involved in cell wall biosynthesis